MTLRTRLFGAFLAALSVSLMPTVLTAQTQRSGGGSLQVLSGCGGGWSGVSRVRARARFAGMPGNHPTQDRVSIFTSGYAAHVNVDADLPLNIWRLANAAGWIGSMAGYGILSPHPSLRRLAVPAGARNAGEIYVRYEVFNFDQISGCTVRLDLVFIDR